MVSSEDREGGNGTVMAVAMAGQEIRLRMLNCSLDPLQGLFDARVARILKALLICHH